MMGIHVTATGGIETIGVPRLEQVLPEALMHTILQFCLDKRSGNIILNIQKGIILGADFQQKVSYR